jgi:hypothetical protein
MNKVTCAIVVAGILCLSCGAAEQGSVPPTIDKEQWREDLRYFARELAKRHKNLYHATTREQFERAVAELDQAIPTLQDHQIVVRMMQVAASVGDGHTGVHIPSYFERYPLRLQWFGKELRVTAAGDAQASALGLRLVKIGDLGIDEVRARVATCFPSAANENEWYEMSTSPAFIIVPEVLHALGIVPGVGPASFTFEDDAGKSIALELAPVELAIVDGKPSLKLTPAVKNPPISRPRPGESLWFTYLPDSQTVYANFSSYDSLGGSARKLFQLVDENPTKRLVIDLRQNGGGDFFVGRKHLIEPVKERPQINQKGKLFVLVGRRTFSAAMVNAIDFRKDTQAILVGEPIGERPNSYSENDEMTLPNSRVVVSYSTRYYQFVDEDVPAVVPDQRIDPTWADFEAGRDPVLDWVLAQ